MTAGALAPGDKLGPYDVVAPLGAGGMGEVYRARDTRLGREVALKVLSTAFAHDSERMARFQREAQVLASLNHPHIASIHGIEEAGGIRALVMELVEGPTLAGRIAAGRVPVDEALEIARQIAEALEAAHEKGIIHRDLKPANVKITPDGTVKVLDFGLAKALDEHPHSSADVENSPTLSMAQTRAGVILGTAAYMSPEQAKGRSADRRADVWAFGVVLYEMLSGTRPFLGEAVSEILAGVIKGEPDWDVLPDDVPPRVRLLIERCLRKDPKSRLRDIGDARVEIEETIKQPGGASHAVLPAVQQNSRRAWLWGGVAVAALGIGVAVGRWTTTRAGSATSAAPIHAILSLPAGTRLDGWGSPLLALSPDGSRVAFVARDASGTARIYLRRLDKPEAEAVPGSAEAEGPFFSPNGQWLGFAVGVSAGSGRIRPELKKYSLSNGQTQSICDLPDYFGASWGSNDTIMFVGAQPEGLWKVSSGGGKPELVANRVQIGGREARAALFWPQILPGGKSVLAILAETRALSRIVVIDVVTREIKDLGIPATFVRYTPTGHLVFARPDTTLMAAPFDIRRLQTKAAPVAILRDISLSGKSAAVLAFSETGTLVYTSGYVRGSGRELLSLVRINRKGAIQPLPLEPDTFGRAARVSPDGKRLAVATWDGAMWVYDLARNTRMKLREGQVFDRDIPLWTPDGTKIVFAGFGGGPWRIFWQSAHGNQEPEILVGGDEEKHPSSWTPDGRTLAFAQYGAGGQGYKIVLFTPSEKSQRDLISSSAQAPNAAISPDGRWIAYTSSESGRNEVYLQSFPGLEKKMLVSTGGGRVAQWSPDAREIFYRSGDQMMAARVTSAPELHIGTPERLFEVEGIKALDIAPDGQWFYALRVVPESGVQTQLQLVVNWFEELKRLAPGAETSLGAAR